jgi:hypothetical protein
MGSVYEVNPGSAGTKFRLGSLINFGFYLKEGIGKGNPVTTDIKRGLL